MEKCPVYPYHTRMILTVTHREATVSIPVFLKKTRMKRHPNSSEHTQTLIQFRCRKIFITVSVPSAAFSKVL